VTVIAACVCISIALAILGERMRPGTRQNLTEWGAILFAWLALVSSIVWTLEG
jgi:hypothetical protein